jgi:TonB-dependent starch-binding outer membrane protein SusC
MKKKLIDVFRRNPMAQKIILTMRLTLFLMVLSVFTAYSSSYAQKTKLNLNVQNTQVKEVLNQIENQSEFFFMFDNKQVDVERKVNMQVNSMNIDQVLQKLFDSTGVNFRIVNRQILLYTENAGSSIMQQSKSVSGKVTDTSGSPLPGVSVVVKGTTTGTITDGNGNFSLSNVPGNSTLQFSFVGMKGQEIVVGGKSTINVTLEEETIGIEEVVAIGYGTVKRSDVTGSVTSISSRDIAETNVMNVDQALQGRMAGVQVSSKSGKPGANMSIRIRGLNSTRGNEPLYVIDGIAIGNGGGADYNSTETYNLNSKTDQFQSFDLSSINPSDIQSIDILKDASATAIYGSRAANGVVVITTKKGVKGQSKVNFDASYGMQRIGKQIEMLDAAGLMAFVTEARSHDLSIPEAQWKPELFKKLETLGYYNTNWQDEVYHEAPMQEYNLSYSGANDKVSYYVSGGYTNQEGILGIGISDFEKYSTKINLETEVRNWLKMGINISGSRTKSNLTDQFNSFSPTYDALASYPYLPVKWDAAPGANNIDLQRFGYSNAPSFIPGGWAGPTGVDGNKANRRNPVAHATMNDRMVEKYMAIGNFYADVQFHKNLTYHISVGGTYNNGNWHQWHPVYYYGYTITENSLDVLRAGHTFGYQKELKHYFTYTLNRDRFSLTLMGGHDATKYGNSNLGGQKEGFPFATRILNLGNALNQQIGGGKSESSLQSFLGRANFSYLDKYLLTATIRRDGSSKFSSANKYANFPSVALAWKASNEEFLKPVTWLSSLKVRTSWGQSGAQNISDFAYLSSIGFQGLTAFGSNNTLIRMSQFNNMANPDVKWETTGQTNLGFDLSVLENRIGVTFDWYNKVTRDLLLSNMPLPSYVGFNGPTVNLGEFQNRGVELQLDYRNILNKPNLIWDFGLNFSRNKNLVNDIGFASKEKGGIGYLSAGRTRTYVGDEFGVFYGYKTEGIFQTQKEIDDLNAIAIQKATELGYTNPAGYKYQTNVGPGDIKFKDVNGTAADGSILPGQPDGKIDNSDVVAIGSPHPKFFYGANTRLSYKGLDLNVFFTGVYGNKIWNQNIESFESLDLAGDFVNQTKKAWENRWVSPEKPGDGKTPRTLNVSNNNNKQGSDRYIEDGSYLRVKTITLGYNLPKSVLSKFKINNLRLYASLNDYFTFTKYSWYNPDIGDMNNSLSNFGVDYASYPNTKTVMFGINLGL